MKTYLKSFSRVLVFTLIALLFIQFSRINVSAELVGAENIPSNYVDIGNPLDLIVLDDGSIWYVDSQNYRIVKVSPFNIIERTIGRQGGNEGEFSSEVRSITQDLNGNLYVLERDCKVDKLDFNGGFLMSWGDCGLSNYSFTGMSIHYDAFSDSILVADQTGNRILKYTKDGEYISQFGQGGTEDGEFAGPYGVTTDAAGKIYVVDGGNSRVEVFDHNYNFLFKFGSEGIYGDYEFFAVTDIEVLSDGTIVVTCQNSQQVKEFDNTGVFIRKWGGDAGLPGNGFSQPSYISKDSNDNIYISDNSLKAIIKYTGGGDYVSTFSNSSKADGRFFYPGQIVYDSIGNMYVLDNGTNVDGRVQKFSNAGEYNSTIINPGELLYFNAFTLAIDRTDRVFVGDVAGVRVVDTSGNILLNFGPEGTGCVESCPGFNGIRGIAFDSSDNVYVGDNGNNKIIKYDTNGVKILEWSTLQDGMRADPIAIFVDHNDNVYVSENSDPYLGGPVFYHQVQKFDSVGNLIATYTDWFPWAYAKDSDFNIYTLEDGNVINKFDPDGNFIEKIGEFGTGSGINQFNGISDFAINPITNTLTATDMGNHRVELFASGTRIKNLISSADVVRSNDDFSLVKHYIDPEVPGADDIGSEMFFGNYLVSDFSVDLTDTRDWGAVGAISLPNYSKSVVTNLNPANAPGVSNTHSLYVVKQPGQVSVHVCPDAVNISDVSTVCSNGYDIIYNDENDPNSQYLSIVNVDGIDYWKIDNLTGTGAMSTTTVNLTLDVSETNVTVGQPVSLTVTARDTNGDPDVYYRGTVAFTSAEGVFLPSRFSFTAPDNGTFTFTDQLAFTEPGDFTVTVTDTINTDLTATSVVIHVMGLTPTPTNTPVPTSTTTVTATPVTTSAVPTATGAVVTSTPTRTPSVSSTITLTPTITSTPEEETCESNPVQSKCLADIEITGVTTTQDNDTTMNVCWNTNIDTKGVINYGLNSGGVYNLASPQEETYNTTHCIALSDLTANSKYLYSIRAESPAGKFAQYNAIFTIGLDTTLPITGSECISTEPYSFNSSHQVLLQFTTPNKASCYIDYGNDTSYAIKSNSSDSLTHTIPLDLTKLNGTSDLYYRITCSTVGETDQCTNKGVISVAKYLPYYQAPESTTLTLDSVFNQYFGTPVKTSGTFATAAVIGTVVTGASAAIAYPQWLSYGFFWFTRKKSKKAWGLVYDDSTRDPIALVIISIFESESGKFVKQTISDIHGKYGFVLDAGNYNMRVEQLNYEKFEKQIKVTENEETVSMDIPLTRANAINTFGRIKKWFIDSLSTLSLALSLLGYILTIIAVLINPNLVNVLVLLLYMVQITALLLTKTPRGWGYVYNSFTKERIKGSFVRLFDIDEGRQIDVQLADNKGRYGFIVPNKEYYIRVDAPGFKFPSSENSDLTVTSASGEKFLKILTNKPNNLVIALDPEG